MGYSCCVYNNVCNLCELPSDVPRPKNACKRSAKSVLGFFESSDIFLLNPISAGVQKSNEQTLVKKVDLIPEINSALCPLYGMGFPAPFNCGWVVHITAH